MSRLSIALLASSLVYCSTLSAGTAYVDNIFGVAKTSNIIGVIALGLLARKQRRSSK